MGESDETLMQKFKNGDEGAFIEIMERYQQKIFNYFLRQLHDYASSEDLTQDVFIRVYKYGQSFDHKKRFKPGFYKIALNLLRREMKYRTDMNQTKTGIITDMQTYTFIDYEIVHAVKTAINQLPPEQREVVILKQYQGLTFSEIAQVTGCSENTVKSRLYQAFTKLRKKEKEDSPPMRY